MRASRERSSDSTIPTWHAETDSRQFRELLAEGRLPECWIPPSRILECRALLETYHDLRAEHTDSQDVVSPTLACFARLFPCRDLAGRRSPGCDLRRRRYA